MRNGLEAKMVTLGRRAENARKLLLYLYTKPIVNSAAVSRLLGITPRAANGLIAEFIKLKILKETTGYQRNRQFLFRDYISLFA